MPRAEPDQRLGAVVRELREAADLSQEELAQRAGLTTGSLARVEDARTAPAWATVVAISEALGVSLAELGERIEAQP